MWVFKRGQESQEIGERQKDHDDKFMADLLSDRENLGMALVQAGYIDEDQLDEAFKAAQRQKKRLRQVLIERKLVTPTDVLQVRLGSSLSVKQEDDYMLDEPVDAQAQPPDVEEIPAAHEVQPEIGEKHEPELKRFTSTFVVVAENAPQVTKDVTITVTPPIRTSLTIEETLAPDIIPEDEPTEVTYTVAIRNTKSAVAKNVTFDWQHLPEWFKVSEVKLDGQVVANAGDRLTPLAIGDIAPGESKSVVILGTAFPA
jgi:hypothetical protein